MDWISINKELPKYYECVFVKLKTGEVIEVWRASSGDYNIWTKFGTNQVYFNDDIMKWGRHKLEPKE